MQFVRAGSEFANIDTARTFRVETLDLASDGKVQVFTFIFVVIM